MSDDAIYRQLLQSLSGAIALANAEDLRVSFENARFFDWFPTDQDSDTPLIERLNGFNVERARDRLDKGRSFSWETDVDVGPREIPVRINLRPVTIGDDDLILIEATDVSKEKEAQYMLDSYSRMAEKNAKDLEKEKERVERLLLNIMPKSVYEELKDFGVATPGSFEDVSILMLDFARFTDMEISQDPSAIVSELNDIFSAFDRIVEAFGCERLRTVGDSYMAACGLPEPNSEHAENVARVALRMRRYLERRNAAHPQEWRCRIGINTGPVIGSLVGIQKYVYDLFGPGVNLAARMETMSEPMRITASPYTYELLKDTFAFTERGEYDVKGFDSMTLYFLEGELGRK